jgi:hypothetical protein
VDVRNGTLGMVVIHRKLQKLQNSYQVKCVLLRAERFASEQNAFGCRSEKTLCPTTPVLGQSAAQGRRKISTMTGLATLKFKPCRKKANRGPRLTPGGFGLEPCMCLPPLLSDHGLVKGLLAGVYTHQPVPQLLSFRRCRLRCRRSYHFAHAQLFCVANCMHTFVIDSVPQNFVLPPAGNYRQRREPRSCRTADAGAPGKLKFCEKPEAWWRGCRGLTGARKP